MTFCGTKYPLRHFRSAVLALLSLSQDWDNNTVHTWSSPLFMPRPQKYKAFQQMMHYQCEIQALSTILSTWGHWIIYETSFYAALVKLVLPYYCKLMCNTLQHPAVKTSCIRFMYSKHLAPASHWAVPWWIWDPYSCFHPSWKHAGLVTGANNACLPGFHFPI